MNIPTLVFSIIDRKTGAEVWRLELPALIVFGVVFILTTMIAVGVKR